MTEELQRRENAERDYLLNRPQWLGIWPTWWFWSVKENWKLVSLPIVVVYTVAFILVLVLNPSPWVAALIVSGLLTLALGLIERHVRRRAVERRALAGDAADEPRPLPPEP